MQHGLDISEADIDYFVGHSSLLSTALRSGYKVWGIAGNDANATYFGWDQLLRTVRRQDQPHSFKFGGLVNFETR